MYEWPNTMQNYSYDIELALKIECLDSKCLLNCLMFLALSYSPQKTPCGQNKLHIVAFNYWHLALFYPCSHATLAEQTFFGS